MTFSDAFFSWRFKGYLLQGSHRLEKYLNKGFLEKYLNKGFLEKYLNKGFLEKYLNKGFLEKYLNKGFLEKYLKIKSALKSTGKSL